MIDFTEKRVLVYGDVMLDRFTAGHCDRLSPEAPIPVLSDPQCTAQLGGAAAVANICRGLGATVSLLAPIGADPAGKSLTDMVYRIGINGKLIEDDRRITTVKHRYYAKRAGVQIPVMRLDTEFAEDVTCGTRNTLHDRADELVDSVDVVLISDYGKGAVDSSVVKLLINSGKPVFVDPPHPKLSADDWQQFKGAAGLCPNREELNSHPYTEKSIAKSYETRVYETAGGMGVFEWHADDCKLHEATEIDYPVDVSGAGDTVLAVLGLTNGADVDLCNKAAGVQIMKRGVQQVFPHEIFPPEFVPNENQP